MQRNRAVLTFRVEVDLRKWIDADGYAWYPLQVAQEVARGVECAVAPWPGATVRQVGSPAFVGLDGGETDYIRPTEPKD